MVTSNVLARTFRILIGESQGTAFTLDIDGRQYLVTAKHLCPTMENEALISIWREDNWEQTTAQVVGIGENDIDIAAFSLSYQLSECFPLPAKIESLALGQDVYFLGFPYGITCDIGTLNNGYPFPLIKKRLSLCSCKG